MNSSRIFWKLLRQNSFSNPVLVAFDTFVLKGTLKFFEIIGRNQRSSAVSGILIMSSWFWMFIPADEGAIRPDKGHRGSLFQSCKYTTCT